MKSNADIIAIQETHLLAADTHRLKHKRFPHVFHSVAKTKRAGVSILIKDSVAFQMHDVPIDPRGGFIILRCTIDSTSYTILSV